MTPFPFSVALGKALAATATLALARMSDAEEATSLRLVREVLANLAIICQDGHHVFFTELILCEPVIRYIDCIIIVEVLHEVLEQLVVVAVG